MYIYRCAYIIKIILVFVGMSIKWVKSFSRVRLFATPWTAAYQASLSMGFSRQEYWSGLPFPSPMHESEKWQRSRSVVSDSLRPHGLQSTTLLRPWDFPGTSTGVGCHFLLQRIFPIQGSNPGLPHCRQMLCHLSHQGRYNCNTTELFLIWFFFLLLNLNCTFLSGYNVQFYINLFYHNFKSLRTS